MLRRLLVECTQLQKARRIRKRAFRSHIEQGRLSGNSGFDTVIRGADGPTVRPIDSLNCFTDISSVIFEPRNYEESVIGTDPFGAIAPSLSSSLVPPEISDLQLHTSTFYTSPANFPCPSLDFSEFGVQSTHHSQTLQGSGQRHSPYYSPDYGSDLEAFFVSGPDSTFPDPVFDSDSESKHSFRSDLVLSLFGAINDFDAPADIEFDLPSTGSTGPKKAIPSSNPPINSTYVRDTFDTGSSLFSDAYSCYDFDAETTFALGGGTSQTGFKEHRDKPRSLSVLRPTSNFPTSTFVKEIPSVSRPSSSSSKISSLLSKMSLQMSPSSVHSSISLSVEVESPISLPGIFPQYCWSHMGQNVLLRCSDLDGSQTCCSKHHHTKTPTHRSLRRDIFARIIQRSIRSKDVDETDTFGNSTLHISATMLAPPSYLVTLIKMGANVNSVNSAGQTFLHLVKPEFLDCSDDFCSLLKILATSGFNFRQHDHLGQSPLHILLRPWVSADVLQSIITTLDSLLIHKHLSTSRDCFGYTVVGQMNLQETTSSARIDSTQVDQAILSLACETENRIVDPKELQLPRKKNWWRNSHDEHEHSARNYENHPCINNVEDLLQHEQHVDYWRTIVAAKHIPSVEDVNGRNALHCLAEASLVSPDTPLPSSLLSQVRTLKDSFLTDTDNDRQGYLKCLIKAGVDVNNYDNNGNTPLMAFVSSTRQPESDESHTEILRLLLKAGSDIDRRNRLGETALHIAIKLGRRAATGLLLASGANIHARTASGLGVLELGQKYCTENKEDENLFGQIMVCMSLAASFGAVSQPTILDEWGLEKWRIKTQTTQKERKGLKMVKKFIGKQTIGRRGKNGQV